MELVLQNVVNHLSIRNRMEKEVLVKTVDKAWKKFDPIQLTNILNC